MGMKVSNTRDMEGNTTRVMQVNNTRDRYESK